MNFSFAISLLCLSIFAVKLVIEFTIARNCLLSKRYCDSVFLFLSAILVILFYGTRGDTGQDYMAYWRVFNDVNSSGLKALIKGYSLNSEIIYSILMLICGRVSFGNMVLGYALFNGVIGFLMVNLVFKTVIRFSDDVFFSVLLFLCHFGFIAAFNTTRSGLAYCILFYAFTYILEGRFCKWMFCWLIAFNIHFSTIILLPIYLVRVAPPHEIVKGDNVLQYRPLCNFFAIPYHR